MHNTEQARRNSQFSSVDWLGPLSIDNNQRRSKRAFQAGFIVSQKAENIG